MTFKFAQFVILLSFAEFVCSTFSSLSSPRERFVIIRFNWQTNGTLANDNLFQNVINLLIPRYNANEQVAHLCCKRGCDHCYSTAW